MVQARRLDAWNHTSAVLALIANVNRDGKKRARPFTAEDFHPYRSAPAGGIRADKGEGLAMLRQRFGAMKPRHA